MFCHSCEGNFLGKKKWLQQRLVEQLGIMWEKELRAQEGSQNLEDSEVWRDSWWTGWAFAEGEQIPPWSSCPQVVRELLSIVLVRMGVSTGISEGRMEGLEGMTTWCINPLHGMYPKALASINMSEKFQFGWWGVGKEHTASKTQENALQS